MKDIKLKDSVKLESLRKYGYKMTISSLVNKKRNHYRKEIIIKNHLIGHIDVFNKEISITTYDNNELNIILDETYISDLVNSNLVEFN
jgi:hypothetical protein